VTPRSVSPPIAAQQEQLRASLAATNRRGARRGRRWTSSLPTLDETAPSDGLRSW